ncbi:hypothetical protein BC833DRAFT_574410 [Globomyces pollinis-pini]|nr:hypothetical protein BC833DRAFT_574410 [Globomyces pollinis-pini]
MESITNDHIEDSIVNTGDSSDDEFVDFTKVPDPKLRTNTKQKSLRPSITSSRNSVSGDERETTAPSSAGTIRTNRFANVAPPDVIHVKLITDHIKDSIKEEWATDESKTPAFSEMDLSRIINKVFVKLNLEPTNRALEETTVKQWNVTSNNVQELHNTIKLQNLLVDEIGRSTASMTRQYKELVAMNKKLIEERIKAYKTRDDLHELLLAEKQQVAVLKMQLNGGNQSNGVQRQYFDELEILDLAWNSFVQIQKDEGKSVVDLPPFIRKSQVAFQEVKQSINTTQEEKPTPTVISDKKSQSEVHVYDLQTTDGTIHTEEHTEEVQIKNVPQKTVNIISESLDVNKETVETFKMESTAIAMPKSDPIKDEDKTSMRAINEAADLIAVLKDFEPASKVSVGILNSNENYQKRTENPYRDLARGNPKKIDTNNFYSHELQKTYLQHINNTTKTKHSKAMLQASNNGEYISLIHEQLNALSVQLKDCLDALAEEQRSNKKWRKKCEKQDKQIKTLQTKVTETISHKKEQKLDLTKVLNPISRPITAHQSRVTNLGEYEEQIRRPHTSIPKVKYRLSDQEQNLNYSLPNLSNKKRFLIRPATTPTRKTAIYVPTIKFGMSNLTLPKHNSPNEGEDDIGVKFCIPNENLKRGSKSARRHN